MSSFRLILAVIVCVAAGFVCVTDLHAAPDTDLEKKPSVDLDGLPMPEGARSLLGSTRFRHSSTVGWLGALDDNKQLLSLGVDGRIRLWDTATGRELKQFTGSGINPFVNHAALSPDRKTLATASNDRLLRIWDTARGKELRQFPATPLPQMPTSLTFSPDGKTLASYSQDHIIRLWDPAEGKELKQIAPPPGEPRSTVIGYQGAQIAFTPDGKSITVVDDWVLRVFDVEEGKEQRWLGGHAGTIYAVMAAPGGKHVVSVGQDRTARVWDYTTGKTTAKLSLGMAGGRSLAVAPDGKTVAVSTSDRNLRLFELPSGKPVSQIETAVAFAGAITFSADGKTLFIGGPDALIRPYDVATGKALFSSRGHLSGIVAMTFTPDGKSLVTAGTDRQMIVWDAATGKVARSIPLPQEGYFNVTSLQFAQDGKSLLSLGFDRAYRRWDLEKGEATAEFVFSPTAFFSSALSPDGRSVVSAGNDRKIRVCDVETEKEISRIEFKTEPPSPTLLTANLLAFGGDGRSLIGLVSDRTLRRWNLKTGVETDRFGPMNITAVATHFGLSADGRTAVVLLNTVPTLLEMATGKGRQSFTVEPPPPGVPRVNTAVTSVVLSPDAQTLATTHTDGSLRFWDCASGKELAVRKGLTYIQRLVFSPDLKSVATLGSDGLVTIWDVPGMDHPSRTRTGMLSAEKAREMWDLLSSDDGPKAFQTVLALAASPKEAVEVARKQLKEQTGVTEKEIAKMIEELDSEEFDVREKATQKLIGLGKAAEEAVRKALANQPTAEAKARLEQILKKSTGGAAYNPELAHAIRAVEVLERIGTPEAQAVLEEAAKGPQSARLTTEAQAALERLHKK
jgi:WD40 repeat protein